MRENTKLIIDENGRPMQVVTRIYRLKDGNEKKVVTTEPL